MRKSKSEIPGGIDLGEPSLAAQEAQSRSAAILAAIEDGGPPVASQELDPAEDAPTVKAKVTRPLRTQKLTLDSTLFKLDIDIYDLQIRDCFICFSLPLSTPALEPKDTMKMNIITAGKTYPVIYVGGYFELPQHGLRIMSFLRDVPKEDDNAQNRKS